MMLIAKFMVLTAWLQANHACVVGKNVGPTNKVFLSVLHLPTLSRYNSGTGPL